MTLTLEEAIKHCKERAEELEKRVKPYQCESINNKLYEVNKKEWDDCLECAKEHRQLAEWLRELEWRRNAMVEIHEAMLMPASMAERISEEVNTDDEL